MLGIRSYRWQNRLVSLVSYVLLILGGLTFLIPFVWMVGTSFKPTGEVFSRNVFTTSPTLSNYVTVIQNIPMGRWYLNTFIVGAVSVVSVVFFSAITGYGLSKYRFPGQQVVLVLILSTLMVPTEMLLIPWYIAAVRLKWVDTFPGIIFPGLVSASAVFIMRQFMQTIPDELMDAARLDGVSELGLLWRIVLPLTRPAMAAVAVFTFMGSWNAYIWPLIVTNSPDMFTLQLGLATAASAEESSLGNWAITMAVSTLISVPGLIVFSFMHRQIVRGIVLTGLKG
jgi:multiple sugar transport system permease protein